MGEAIAQVLVLGVAVSLSPIPIIGIVLMLETPRARSNAPAFLLGWATGLATAGALVLLISSGADASDHGAPADWVSVLKLVLGALLLGLALKTWRQRPRGGEEPPIPEWMRAIDRVTPGRAAMLGLALAAINPKSLLLTVAAAAGIAQTGIDAGEQALVLGLFALIGTIGLALPMVISFRLGDRAAESLAALRRWMVANNAAIIAVIFLLIAAKLIGDGISGLSA